MTHKYEIGMALVAGVEFGLWQQNIYACGFMTVIVFYWLVSRK